MSTRKLSPLKHLILIITLVLCLVSSSNSGADTPCKDLGYQTLCKDNESCEWDNKKSKCKEKKTYTGCSSHSEFYCEAYRCQWNPTKRKCEDKGHSE